MFHINLINKPINLGKSSCKLFINSINSSRDLVNLGLNNFSSPIVEQSFPEKSKIKNKFKFKLLNHYNHVRDRLNIRQAI